jgi:hypothetical protein
MALHPTSVGDITVAMLTAHFLKLGFAVLKPVTELSRYDLVIDRGNGFETVQCKTGRLKDGCVRFFSASSANNKRHSYKGQVDLFGVYCPETDRCYLVPVDEAGSAECYLRVEPAKNNQVAKTRLAEAYMI